MIAIMERELVEKRELLPNEEFLDIIAIAESTPGPIAINSATYIGYKSCGFFGSLFATLGVVLPSFIIIFIISLFFDAFIGLQYVRYAFKGIQACVAFLIFSAGVRMFSKLKKSPLNMTLYAVTVLVFVVLAVFFSNISAVYYILIGGAVGVIVYLVSLIFYKTKKVKSDSQVLQNNNEETCAETTSGANERGQVCNIKTGDNEK